MTAEASGRLEIVTTPTFDWLAESAASCKTRLLVASPFVNEGITGLTDLVPSGVAQTLFTRTDLRDFALGSSNLNSLCKLAEGGVSIHSLEGLHAKVYIFDDTSALVTSANATFSGMYRNWECGLATSDRWVVSQLARSLFKGFGMEEPPREMKPSELRALRAPVKAIKAAVPGMGVPAAFSISDREAFLKRFRGWKRLTLRGVLAMPADGFSLRELSDVCAPLAAKEYPTNRFAVPQLRKQLQILRDLGLVEFMHPERPGWYRFTLKVN